MNRLRTRLRGKKRGYDFGGGTQKAQSLGAFFWASPAPKKKGSND
jgi:hypothetical protein